MKKLIPILVIILLSFSVGDYTLLYSIDGDFDAVTIDITGNIYTVSGNVLSKYDSNGKLIKTYSEKSYGNISLIDPSDQFKILVFYKDFNKIIFLDNMLSPSGDPIDVQSLGIQQPVLTCTSYQNGFWVFDQTEHELVRYDKNLGASNRSGNIVLLTGNQIQPDYLIESNGYVFLNDSSSGIYVFDKFGTYYKTLPFKGLQDFQVNGENILYCSNKKFISYNFKIFEEKILDLPEGKFLSAKFYNNRLITLDTAGIKTYAIK